MRVGRDIRESGFGACGRRHGRNSSGRQDQSATGRRERSICGKTGEDILPSILSSTGGMHTERDIRANVARVRVGGDASASN
jgi:hypothetical protein